MGQLTFEVEDCGLREALEPVAAIHMHGQHLRRVCARARECLRVHELDMCVHENDYTGTACSCRTHCLGT